MREKKDFRFDIKEVKENGEFEGLAATYGNVDHGGDVIEPGAFTKTISERPEIPVLWSHDPREPIGLGSIEDSDKGLVIKGKLELDLPEAEKAYIRLKKKLVKGLSIGFETVKKARKAGVRRLQEIKLWEVSLVTFPMNDLAQVTAVKNKDGEEKVDFNTALDAAELWAKRTQMLFALWDSLDSIIFDNNLGDEEKLEQVETSIDQFHEQYLDFLPKFFALMRGDLKEVMIGLRDTERPPASLVEYEEKAGRRLSDASKKRIEAAIQALQALLEGEAADTGTSDDGAAKQHSGEPEQIHSLLTEHQVQSIGEM
jgi:HK97 family phage prohead protease